MSEQMKPIRVYVDGREIVGVFAVNERAMSVDFYAKDANGRHILGRDGAVTETIAARQEIRLVRG